MTLLWLAAAAAADFTACELDDAYDRWTCVYETAKRNGAWEEGRTRLQAAVDAEPDAPAPAMSLAFLESALGEEQAAARLEGARDGFDALGHTRGSTRSRFHLADLAAWPGDDARARTQLDEALELAQHGDAHTLAAAKVQLARQLWREHAELQRAYALWKEAREAALPDGPYRLKVLVFHVGAGLASATSRPREADELRRALVELAVSEDDLFLEVAGRLNVLRDWPVDPHDIEQAAARTAFARTCLERAEALGSPRLVAPALCELAHVTPPDEALPLFERCLSAHEEMDDQAELAIARLGLADLVANSDPDRADALLAAAVTSASQGRDRWDLASARFLQAVVAWKQDDRTHAETAGSTALAALDDMVALEADPAARAELLATWRGVPDHLAWRLADPPVGAPDLDAALAVVERQRARELLAHHERSAADRPQPDTPEATEHAEVVEAIVALQQELRDPAARERVLAELEPLEAQEAALREALAAQAGTDEALLLPDPPSTAALQSLLDGDEALLSFHLPQWDALARRDLPPASVLLVTPAEVHWFELGTVRDLEASVEALAALVEGRGDASGPAGHLEERLLGEALAALPATTRRLVVVPDGALHQLPFPALGTTPLGLRYELAVTPSATLWAQWRSSPWSPETGDALVMADPDPDAQGDAETRASSLADLHTLGPLPHARAEAEAVTDLVGGIALLAEAASEQALKTGSASGAAVLHLAAHAVVDPLQPERSAVVLAPGAEGEDGLLQHREIVGLDVPGVVFLSACSTAGGKLLGSEGPLGLARSFFHAGARTVVGSLWPVRDDEAAEMVTAVYTRLADGASVAAAVAGARQELAAAGAPAAAWAGWTVLGDGDAVPFPGGVPGGIPWLPLGLGLAVVGAGAWGFGARRKR